MKRIETFIATLLICALGACESPDTPKTTTLKAGPETRTYTASATPKVQHPGAESPEKAYTIPLMRDVNMRTYVLETEISGARARFIFDTGATHTTCDYAWVKKQFPSQELFPIQVAGSTNVDTHLCVFKGTLTGFPEVRTAYLFAVPIDAICNVFTPPIQGILGMDILRHQSFIFSPATSTLKMGDFSPDSSWIPLPCGFDNEGRCFIKITARGQTYWMLLDTGASQSFFPVKSWDKLGDERTLKATDVNGAKNEKIHVGFPQDFEFVPGITLENYTAALTENPKNYLLGIDVLARFEIMFTPKAVFFRPLH